MHAVAIVDTLLSGPRVPLVEGRVGFPRKKEREQFYTLIHAKDDVAMLEFLRHYGRLPDEIHGSGGCPEPIDHFLLKNDLPKSAAWIHRIKHHAPEASDETLAVYHQEMATARLKNAVDNDQPKTAAVFAHDPAVVNALFQDMLRRVSSGTLIVAQLPHAKFDPSWADDGTCREMERLITAPVKDEWEKEKRERAIRIARVLEGMGYEPPPEVSAVLL